jgi:hypothetical protein
MAHFAELDENNKVLRVIVIADKDTANDKGEEKEEIGIAFCKSLFGEDTKWVQTSYNANFRGSFAAIDDLYDADNDTFVIQPRCIPMQATLPQDDYIDAEVIEPTKAIE